MRMSKTARDLTLTLREARRILDTGKAATKAANEATAAIRADGDRSEAYKARKVDEVNEILDNQLRGLSKQLEGVYGRLSDHLDRANSDFDFEDQSFQRALTAVSALGKGMPFEMQRQVVDRFQGRPTMLRAVKQVFQQNGYGTEHIDELIGPFNSMSVQDLDALRETVIYSNPQGAAASWRTNNGVFGLLDKLSGAFGVDASTNPFKAEIEAMRQSTPDGTPKARSIDRFLTAHAGDLDNDERGAMTLADAMLDEWGTGESDGE